MEKKTKLIIGASAVLLLATAFFTRKKWMPKKEDDVKSTETPASTDGNSNSKSMGEKNPSSPTLAKVLPKVTMSPTLAPKGTRDSVPKKITAEEVDKLFADFVKAMTLARALNGIQKIEAEKKVSELEAIYKKAKVTYDYQNLSSSFEGYTGNLGNLSEISNTNLMELQ